MNTSRPRFRIDQTPQRQGQNVRNHRRARARFDNDGNQLIAADTAVSRQSKGTRISVCKRQDEPTRLEMAAVKIDVEYARPLGQRPQHGNGISTASEHALGPVIEPPDDVRIEARADHQEKRRSIDEPPFRFDLRAIDEKIREIMRLFRQTDFVGQDVARAERNEADGKIAFRSPCCHGSERAVTARGDNRIAKSSPPRRRYRFGSFRRIACRDLKNIGAARPHAAQHAIEPARNCNACCRIEDECEPAAHEMMDCKYDCGGTLRRRHAWKARPSVSVRGKRVKKQTARRLDSPSRLTGPLAFPPGGPSM